MLFRTIVVVPSKKAQGSREGAEWFPKNWTTQHSWNLHQEPVDSDAESIVPCCPGDRNHPSHLPGVKRSRATDHSMNDCAIR